MISLYLALPQPGDLEQERAYLFAEYAGAIRAGLVNSNDLFLECLWERDAVSVPGLLSALQSSVCVLTLQCYLPALVLAKAELCVFPLQGVAEGLVVCRRGTKLPPWIRAAKKDKTLEGLFSLIHSK